jgi:hypothetical protein
LAQQVAVDSSDVPHVDDQVGIKYLTVVKRLAFVPHKHREVCFVRTTPSKLILSLSSSFLHPPSDCLCHQTSFPPLLCHPIHYHRLYTGYLPYQARRLCYLCTQVSCVKMCRRKYARFRTAYQVAYKTRNAPTPRLLSHLH